MIAHGLVPLPVVAAAFVVGSAILALWILVRLSHRMPPHLTRALLLCAGAAAACNAAGRTAPSAVAAVGPAATLLALMLPALVFAFWSAGRLVQALAAGTRS